MRFTVSAPLKLALTALLVCVCCAPAPASDWVEDGVTEFQTTRDGRLNDNRSNQISSPERTQSNQSEDSSVFDIKKNQQHGEPFVPPPGGVVKDVTDNGGVELGPDGKPRGTRPLQANISTWQKPAGYEAPGIDARAEKLLMQSPVYATPKTVAVEPKSFRAWLNETHPGLSDAASKEVIVEIKGQWDDSSHPLRSFGLPYTRVTGQRFADVNLDKTRIVIVNCAGNLPNEAILSLRRFVAMGGFLVTTDWALSGVVQKAFPGFVEWNGGYTDGKVVDAVEVDRDDAGLFANTPPVAHWKLDKKSQTVKINKPGPVRVLVRSRFLMREDPSQLGVLAFLLEYGHGQVLHLVGHFDNNSELAFNNALPDPAPGIDISLRQAITANFIARALKSQAADNTGTEVQSD